MIFCKPKEKIIINKLNKENKANKTEQPNCTPQKALK